MKNVIFDFGNVLVGYRPELFFTDYFQSEARSWWFLRHVADGRWRGRMDAGEPVAECVAELSKEYPEYGEAIAAFDERYFDMFTGEVPGMRQLLIELRKRPDVCIFGLTNWSDETFAESRRRFDILQLVDHYVVSGEEHCIKPDPRIFRILMERYGLAAEECVFIDDSEANVEAARRLGMEGILFRSADDVRRRLGFFRGLTTDEVAQLERQGCTASDWSMVRVADGIDLSLLRRSHFEGRVEMGSGVEVVQSQVGECELGSGSRILRVGWLYNYDIEQDCHIEGVGEMSYSMQGATADVMNENGGRAIALHPDMTVGDAYLYARFRDRAQLMTRMRSFSQCTHGRVGRGSTIHGATALIDGHVGEGCCVGYGVIAERFLLCENVKLEAGLRLNDTVVGDNSTLARGEVGNSLIFPAHEQHHNSSFLIAALVQGQSNVASGATLGSNHNGRTPDGELSAGRGFWPGLCVSLKHNCRFASYTLLSKADYPSELNITLPFALVNNNGAKNRLEVMPAYWWMHNMYALQRNSTKFAQRDRRQRRVQHIEFAPFAPDTAEEMLIARELIHTWTERAYREHGGHEVLAYGMERGKRPTLLLRPAEGYRAYEEMLVKYAMEAVGQRRTFEGERTHVRRWHNVGGQLVADDDLQRLLADVEQSIIPSWKALHRRMDDLWADYCGRRAEHGYAVLCHLSQKQSLDAADWHRFEQQYAAVQRVVADRVIASKQKDRDNEYRQTTFLNAAEMRAVMGED